MVSMYLVMVFSVLYADGWCAVPWCMQVVGVYLVAVFCVFYVDDSVHMVGMYRVHGITLVYSDVNLRLNLSMLGTQSLQTVSKQRSLRSRNQRMSQQALERKHDSG